MNTTPETPQTRTDQELQQLLDELEKIQTRVLRIINTIAFMRDLAREMQLPASLNAETGSRALKLKTQGADRLDNALFVWTSFYDVLRDEMKRLEEGSE
jgi:hypothetical protein